MADNYLENKMEEYRAGKSRAAAARTPRGSLDLRLSRARVLVAGDMTAVVEACARAFAAAGARTAVVAAASERCGTARCYGGDADVAEVVKSLIHDWLEIDVLVIAGADCAGVAAAVMAARESIPQALRCARFARVNINIGDAVAPGLNITIADAAAQAQDAALLATVLCRREWAGKVGIEMR